MDTIFSVRSVRSDGGTAGNGMLLATVVDVGTLQLVFRVSVFALTMFAAR